MKDDAARRGPTLGDGMALHAPRRSSSGAPTASATATRSGPATSSWSFADLDGAQQRVRPAARRRAASGAGDRVAVMMTNRPEFVVAVARRSASSARPPVLLSPAWKARRGRPRARADRAGARGRRRRRRVALLAERARRRRVTDLDDRSTVDAALGRRVAAGRRRCADDRRGGARVQLRHHRAAEGGAPHARVDGPRHPPLVRRARPRARRPVPGRHAAVAHPRPAQPAGGGARPGRRVRLHRALRPRRGAAPHRDRPHDARDGGRADRAGDGQPPDARGLRPLVAALHHVGRDAGDRERRRDVVTERTGVRLAARLRRQRAAGDRRATRSTTRRVAARLGRPAAGRVSSCGSSTSTPATSLAARRDRRDPGARARR